jgi:hypothetical protein
MAVRKVRLCHHPDHLHAEHYLLLQDWLNLIEQGKQACVDKMIEMCQDLYLNGLETRFKKHLFGPVYELKRRTPIGGARVYFFSTNQDEFVLVHGECKKESKADIGLLNDVADVLEAYERKMPRLLNPIKEGGNGKRKSK